VKVLLQLLQLNVQRLWDPPIVEEEFVRYSKFLQARHFSLFGHFARMPDETDAKKVLTAAAFENWRRLLGRPCTTWMKTIQQDLKSKNL